MYCSFMMKWVGLLRRKSFRATLHVDNTAFYLTGKGRLNALTQIKQNDSN
jgi:hypothetical protein